jgi:ABC-type antimicrobial peptide transport system permease subunit
MQSKLIMEKYSLLSYILIFFMAGIGIFGVVLVSVLERLREFAILQAIGTPFNKVAEIIFLESIFIGFAGFLLGSLLGGGTLYYFYIYGLDLSNFSDALDEFGMDAITYAVIKTSYFVTGFSAVIIAVFFSVLFPLYILKKSKPIEVING